MRIVYFGVAAIIACLNLDSAGAAAPVESVVHSFAGHGNGTFPFDGLTAGAGGVFYGATPYSGHASGAAGNYPASGNGAVFKLSPAPDGQLPWSETVVYTFCSQSDCADGFRPYSGVIIDSHGALYGTTYSGGSGGKPGVGHGTVFKLTPPGAGETAWTHSVLHSFNGGADGSHPVGRLIADQQGALYGTTVDGGGADGSAEGCGVVFKLTPPASRDTGWTETVLHRFKGGGDGCSPDGALLADATGVLYGTISQDRDGGPHVGNGMVFKLTPPAKGQTDWTETVLYRFRGGDDGRNPQGALIADDQGALYGATTFGGGTGGGLFGDTGNGTIFKLTPSSDDKGVWTETVLYRFKGGADGAAPAHGGGLLADKDGALYGVTTAGGEIAGAGPDGSNGSGFGTVFKLTPARGQSQWTETILYRFPGGHQGGTPNPGLIPGERGALYGTTHAGGASDFGAVFKLSLCPDQNDAEGAPGAARDGCPVFLSADEPFPGEPLPAGPARTRFVFHREDEGAPAQSAPDLSQSPHRLTADIDTGQNEVEGVIVEQGGSGGGYSLFVKDGKLTFESNASGEIRQTLVARWPLPPGKVRVAFEFKPDSGPIATLAALLGRKNSSGTGRLLINGVEAAQAHFAKLGSAPTESFDIGKDTGSPVSLRYEAPFAFSGKIDRIQIDRQPSSATGR